MKDLIDPDTGQLLDFIPRQGDPAEAFEGNHRSPHSRRRWGRRVLLSSPGSVGAIAQGAGAKVLGRAVMVTTEDLGRTYPIRLRSLFATPVNNISEGATTGEPTIFSPNVPNFGALPTTFVKFTVRKTTDMRTSPQQDIYQIPLGNAVGGLGFADTLPIDTVEARHLSVEAEIIGAAGVAMWVDVTATIIDGPSEPDKLTGWTIPTVWGPFVANNVTAQLFLQTRYARRQFIIVNTSTDATLALFFLATPGSVSPATINQAQILLPPGGFNTYESPIGGYNGPIVGMWYGGAPNGVALVSDGAAYI